MTDKKEEITETNDAVADVIEASVEDAKQEIPESVAVAHENVEARHEQSVAEVEANAKACAEGVLAVEKINKETTLMTRVLYVILGGGFVAGLVGFVYLVSTNVPQ